MLKASLSAFILFVHISVMIYYCMLDRAYKNDHIAMCTAMFYGSALILPALNNLLIHCEDTAYQIGIYHAHNLFALLIGTIYVLHYTGYLITTNSQQLLIFCIAFLIIFITIFVNVMRYGLYKK